LPGVNSKGAFFTRGSGHNKLGGYTEIPDEYQEVMDRLLRKHKEAAGFVPAPIIETREGATVGVITIGGCDSAVREALDILAAEGTPMDYMRLAPSPSTNQWKLSSPRTITVMSSNRTATPSFAPCSSLKLLHPKKSCGPFSSTEAFR
jgi:2-oxoglutarate ferredoxin oxidoreductase subunit alpha